MDPTRRELKIYKRSLQALYDGANAFDEIVQSYGYLGALIDPKFFKKPIDFPECYLYMDEHHNIPEWSVHMLKQKVFSTDHEYVIDYMGDRQIIKISVLLRFINDYHTIPAIYDDNRQIGMFLDEHFSIIKCITFDGYIRSSNTIKRAWKKYKIDKFRKKIAATKIQRAILQYLYRPSGILAFKLKNRFYL
jgi:hypothetical protein